MCVQGGGRAGSKNLKKSGENQRISRDKEVGTLKIHLVLQ